MNKLVISLLIFAGAFHSLPVLAQEKSILSFLEENVAGKEEWLWGFSYLRWSETLRLQKSTLLDRDTANFTGLNLNLERQMLYPTWGWSAGISFGSGRANGGGNSTVVTYQRNNEAWTSFGAVARVFHRLSPRISVGAAMPLMFRNIGWLSPDGLTKASSGQNMNLGLLFDLVLRVDKRLDFYQEIGTMNAQGSTLWRLGINIKI